MNAQWTDRIAAVVDPDEVCRLALDLCDIASPTGEEDALSAFIVDCSSEMVWLAFAKKLKPIDPMQTGIVRKRKDLVDYSFLREIHQELAIKCKSLGMTHITIKRLDQHQ